MFLWHYFIMDEEHLNDLRQRLNETQHKTLEYIIKTETLDDRLSRHSERIEKTMLGLESKLETRIEQAAKDREYLTDKLEKISEKIGKVERESLIEVNSAKVKIATISGTISALITFLTLWIKEHLRP